MESPKNPKKSKNPPGIRINKFLSQCGIGSRRKCEEYITEKRVIINGRVITDFATRVSSGDKVIFDGTPLKPEKYTYIAFNKPKGVITTLNDPRNRKHVGHFLEKLPYVKPIGRLDRNTTGILLLTNDGDLHHHLTHPKFQIPKIYKITINANVPERIFAEIEKGISLDDGKIARGKVLKISGKMHKTQITLELREGHNREIRRMFETFGLVVTKLDRIKFAGIGHQNLLSGRWRHLSPSEIKKLQKMCGLLE